MPKSIQANPNLCQLRHKSIDEAIPVWGRPPVQSLATVNYPANNVLLTEASGSRIFTDGNDTISLSSAPTVAQQCQAVHLIGHTRHSGSSIYLLADGHAKWFKAPVPSFTRRGTNWWQIDPISSTFPVVYRYNDTPGAAAWFKEN